MLRYWIWLAERKGLRLTTVQRLLYHFATPLEIYQADRQALRLLQLTEREIDTLMERNLSAADRILGSCEQHHIRVITMQDSEYPLFLKEIDGPPPVLYCRGRLPELSERPVIGVVGARRASFYAQQAAASLGYQIARCGAVVVTGLARGVDSQAADGVLKAEGAVIGVLGCGVDVVYPPENATLFADVQKNGCILSEFPPGTEPRAENFPVRNRIISGLCDGVIVVEAGERSGALITARWATEQGRDVFVVPGHIFDPACAGSNRLLQSGAIPVTCGWDAVREYEYRYPDTVTPYCAGPLRQESAKPAPAPETQPAPEAQPAPQKEALPIDVKPLLDSVSPDERALLLQLAEEEHQLDELIDLTGLPAARALTAATLLSVKGHIRQLPGKRFRLADRKE